MAPVKPLTHPRGAASKGKAVPCPTTRPHVRKVTQIATPMPEVATVEAPPPPIVGPSWARCAPLFEEAEVSGDDRVEKGAPASSGKCFMGLPVRFTDCGCYSIWHSRPVEAQGRRDPCRGSSPSLSPFTSPSTLPTPSYC